MSRSKKDILETEAMLTRLTNLLVQHGNREGSDYWAGRARGDAESLRRISMTLHRWHELECGDSNNKAAWAIVRGRKVRNAPSLGKSQHGYTFEHDDDGAPFMERHHYYHGRGEDTVHYHALPDRETGARKRLAAILKRYPTLTAYVQGDPRGCALYILTKADVPEGATVDSCYSRGLAVHQ